MLAGKTAYHRHKMCRDWRHIPTWLLRALRRGGAVLLSVLCFSLTACGDASTAQALQTVTSWAATAHLVGDAWVAHAAPQAYVVQTLRHARRQLHTQLRTLQSHHLLPRRRRARRSRAISSAWNTPFSRC